MTKARSKGSAGGTCEGTTAVAVGAGLGLLGSVIVNLVQAKEGKDLERQLAALKADYKRLLGTLSDWQSAYDRLNTEFCGLKDEHVALTSRYESVQADLLRVMVERDKGNEEIWKLRAEVLLLRDQLKDAKAAAAPAKTKEK